MHRQAPGLLLLCVLTFFLGLGRQAITDSDEAYYAEAAREMVETGDWLTPRFNYEDRWQKPVLYYWLTAATYLVAGPTEWAARLWSALSGAGLVLLTYAAGRRFALPDRSAWLAGAIVATCFGCFAEARLALPDLPLTFCITLGLWAALNASVPSPSRHVVSGPPEEPAAAGREDTAADAAARRVRLGWWALAGLAAGLGFLMKGPVALVIPGIVLLPIWWLERRAVSIPPAGVLVAALAFAIAGLPWYLAMWAEHGGAYLESFFLGDNLERFATGRFQAERRPIWFYLPIVAGGLMPWSAFLLVPLQSAVARWRERRSLTEVEWRLLLWAGMPLLFYTASIGKQPRYILPVLPPLAILLAGSLATAIRRDGVSPFSRTGHSEGGGWGALRAATWITAATLGVVAFLFARTHSVFVNAYAATAWAAVAVTGAAALAIGTIAVARSWTRLPIVLPVAAAFVLLGVQFGALAGARPEAVEQMAALVGAHRRAGEPVAVYNVFVRNLVFYTRTKHVILEEETAVPYLRSGRGLLVVRARDLPALKEASGVELTELGRVRYFNAANVRLRTFLRPVPEEEIETVLLVDVGRAD